MTHCRPIYQQTILEPRYYSMFKTGVIYHFTPCRASEPVKNKYAICVSGRNKWFYLINSCSDTSPMRPYEFENGQVVYFNNFQNETLKRRSYINILKLKVISETHYDYCKEYERISNMIWLKIRNFACEHDGLSAHIKEILKTEKIV